MGGIVVIAGGSGLVGEALCHQLMTDGFIPRLLSRSAGSKNGIETFKWDPLKNEIDLKVFENAGYIINLAGENVGKGKWTDKRKQELINSRIQSTNLLVDTVNKNNLPIKKFIQASAVGYYGFGNESKDFVETDAVGNDFLAQLCLEWENATNGLNTSVPRVIVRIGVVFSSKGGAFTAMAKPVKYFLGAPIGSGKQIVPWIHIEDLVRTFVWVLKQNDVTGVYNAVAPDPKSNKELTKQIARVYKTPVWPIGVPSILLKLALGEQAQIVLEGNKVSPNKLLQTGFKFKFPGIIQALQDLIKK